MTERLHPVSMMIFFLFTIILPAFTGNPCFYLLSFLMGLIMLFNTLPSRTVARSLTLYIVLPVLIACFNSLFYHDGSTILFYLNGMRITFEAFAYGMSSGLMVNSVLIWCRLLSHYFTGDKIMYLFGTFSPKTALIISMVLRFVPMYREHIDAYRNTQKLLGIYGEGTLFERIRGEFKIFGGFLSWLLEHSMTTSDSMTARGYGAARRRAFKLFSFKSFDTVICIIVLLSTGFTIYCIITGVFRTEFYPMIIFPPMSLNGFIAGIMFLTVSALPTAADIIYRIKCRKTYE